MKRRNQLKYDKVFDTAVVRIDFKRKHAAERLTRSRLKRQFGSPALDSAVSAAPTKVDQNDEAGEEIPEVDMEEEECAELDFAALAAQLRQDVVDDEDPLNDDEVSPSWTIQRFLSGCGFFFGTQVAIELKDIFDYEDPEKRVWEFSSGPESLT